MSEKTFNIEILDFTITGITDIPNKGAVVYFTPFESDSNSLNNRETNLMIIDNSLEDNFLKAYFKGNSYGDTRVKWFGCSLKIAFANYMPVALIINNSNICLLENHYTGNLYNITAYSNHDYLKQFDVEWDDLIGLIKAELPKIK